MTTDQTPTDMQTMTDAQEKASNPATSAWVSASAGTGKTHVLTNRVLRLLLGGADPSAILCLTFTKAAASEMSNRINRSLASWTTMDEEDLAENLEKLAGETSDPERTTMARQLFAYVLEVPGGLRIDTIHAFCQSLIRRFPLEAGVAPHFTVVDDRTANELRESAIARTLAKAGDSPDSLSQAIKHIAGHVGDASFKSLSEDLIANPDRLANLPDEADVEAALRGFLGLDETATETSVLANACSDDALDRKALVAAINALKTGGKTDVARAVQIQTWLVNPGERRALGFWDYALAYLTKTELEPRKTLATKGVTEANPEVITALWVESDRISKAIDMIRQCRVLAASMAAVIYGRALVSEYTLLKRQHGAMDYDDLILSARDLVAGHNVGDVATGAAWVLYKLDAGIDHILVDEAQDTNPLQWQIIESLAYEFFTGLGARDNPRTIFAVGDPKQSIYGFQGAEPAEFERTRAEFKRRSAAAEQRFHDGMLDLSFRSTKAVLALVDATFAGEMARDGLLFGDRNQTITHDANRKEAPGQVEIWPPEEPVAPPEQDNWAPPVAQLKEQATHVRLADRIAGQIDHWITSAEILGSSGLPITAGDVLILVRRRNAFFTAMVRALKQHGIAVAGMDRMVLNDQLVVMDLLALARFALMPEDDLNLAILLRSPLIGMGEDDLYTLAHKRPTSLWATLQASRRKGQSFGRACDLLQYALSRADYVPPFEFYSGILEGGSGRKELLQRLGSEAEDPMDEFMTLAMDYERNHPPSLQAFVHWIDAQETPLKREMDQARGEVRVMTVHGAKGLQAPIVFLPDTRSTVPARQPALLWRDDQDGMRAPVWPIKAENAVGPVAVARDGEKQADSQEYNRQLYVAMTRAEDRLYVCGYNTNRKSADGCWYNLVAAGFDQLDDVQDVTVFDGGSARRHEQGKIKTTKSVVESDTNTPKIDAEPLPVWATTNPQPEPSPARPLAPSRPAASSAPVRSPFAPDQKARFIRGNLIHHLLEVLPDLPVDQRHEAASQILARSPQNIDEATGAAWVTEVMAILEDPTFAPIFGDDSLAEISLAGLAGNQAFSGQIDRLVVGESEILIVDYKSNRPPPSFAADVPPIYLRQMAAYRDLLQQIYPGHKVETALLWTDGPTLMPLPDAQLDEYSEMVTVV